MNKVKRLISKKTAIMLVLLALCGTQMSVANAWGWNCHTVWRHGVRMHWCNAHGGRWWWHRRHWRHRWWRRHHRHCRVWVNRWGHLRRRCWYGP